jgi:hypothetical protein
MRRLGIALAIGVALLSAASIAKPPSPTKPAAPAQKAPPAPRPNASAKCSIALTQPDTYQRDYTSLDYCVVDAFGAILFEPKVIVGGVADRADRDLSVQVDPTLAAGAVVALSTAGEGQATDRILIRCSGGTNETRCMNLSGSATLVAPRPNLDVKFDLTCMIPGPAQGLRVVGEFTSTL